MNNDNQEIVLIVDDEPASIHPLAEALNKKYKVLIATSGKRALELVENEGNKPDIILLDVLMPEMNGIEVCLRLKTNPVTQNIPVIFITIVDDPQLEEHGFGIGAYDYIKKPFNVNLVKIRIDLHLELKRYRDNLEAEVEKRTKEVEALNLEIIDTQKEIIATLGDVVETRSKETFNHVQRVSHYTYLLAQKAILSNYGNIINIEEAEILKAASPMHDVGKIGIPEAILNKPAKLTEKERNEMEKHSQLGYDILNKSDRRILKTAALIAHQHHERWDGNGYPQGLKGEEIHIYGRITSIADVFDALVNKRAYKEAWSIKRIKTEFKKERGKQFDPKLTDLFLENITEFEAILNKFPDKREL